MATNPCWYYRNYNETDDTHLVKNDWSKIYSIEELGWDAPTDGRVFKEWNESPDGDGDSYTPIAEREESPLSALYAIWDYRFISKVDLNGEVYYLKDKFTKPLIIEADWLGTDWEIDRDRGSRCFSINSISKDELQTAVSQHRRIILILHNNIENDDFQLSGNQGGTPIFYTPQNLFETNINLFYLQNQITYDGAWPIYFLFDYDKICTGYITFYSQEYEGFNAELEISYHSSQNIDLSEYALITDVPEEETMANVKATLAKYGLDTTTEFTSPIVGTGVVGQTVSMPS